MKIKWKPLAVCMLLPLALGAVVSVITMNAMSAFETLQKPPLSPPGWLFPVVWTILYLIMGYASYRVWMSGNERRRDALQAYGFQLFLNLIWPLLFFSFGWYGISFAWLVALWIAVLVTLLRFRAIDKTAGWLLAPYLVWLTFAGYLNLGVFLLNQK